MIELVSCCCLAYNRKCVFFIRFYLLLCKTDCEPEADSLIEKCLVFLTLPPFTLLQTAMAFSTLLFYFFTELLTQERTPRLFEEDISKLNIGLHRSLNPSCLNVGVHKMMLFLGQDSLISHF